MTMPSQLDVIEQHIADAMACGGRAVVGGLGSIRKPYVGPVILADVPDMAPMGCASSQGRSRSRGSGSSRCET
jgi:hypothetical protein